MLTNFFYSGLRVPENFDNACNRDGDEFGLYHMTGQQFEMRTESLAINMPAGLADGARIRVPGKGHVGRNGGDTGDLYITVQVRPHPLFARDGDDLLLTVPIAVHEAALGAKIEVPSLEGPARLRVPPGTQSGQRFRLRERGVASRATAAAAIW